MTRKLIFSLLILLVVGFLISIFIESASQVGNNQGYAPTQPIAFSHKLHAGENEIQCLYCHSGSERSRHAGIPSASICMNCHTNIKQDSEEIQKIKQALEEQKPIQWKKVHRLADFVYFSHEQHVGSGEISCQTCHGPVDKMAIMRQEEDLSMGWCIDCHRKADIVVHGTTDVKKVSDTGGMDCAKCHY
ncbi:MAG: cytochrome c3 family protein [Deltaproteobacteria bacterium]|nr:cytochrome c3 family protein [Deltaproteobacteria bacterium]